MPKRKQIVVTPGYISFIKDKLPFGDEEYWWKPDVVEKVWEMPTKIEFSKLKPKSFEETKTGKKIQKLKLRYTQQQVKQAIQEDKEALKDVQKLEKHLEEDIQKAQTK